MKKTFKILLICFCAGCSTRKINYEPHVNQVVSQFLRSELANEKYRSFADKQIYIIENSNELKAIEVYEYALKMIIYITNTIIIDQNKSFLYFEAQKLD